MTSKPRRDHAPLAGNGHVLDHLAALGLAHRVHRDCPHEHPDAAQAAQRALTLARASAGGAATARAQQALGLWVVEHHQGNPDLRDQAHRALQALTAT